MKKLLSLLLTFVMIFSFMAAPVSAAGNNEALPAEGVIYLNGMHDNIVYKLYKVFDLNSVSSDGTAFSYQTDDEDPWFNFLKTNQTAIKYLVVDQNGGITKTSAFTGEEATIELAKAAIAYANDPSKGVQAFATGQKGTDGTYFKNTTTGGMFVKLPAGYYLFESAVGTLGALVTARPNVPAYISVKNNVPTLTKDVFEDSTQSWLAYNSAEIGQVIQFRATIDAQAGAENYAFHDFMSGMRFLSNTVKVEHQKNKYTSESDHKVELIEGEHYEVKADHPHKNVTFGIKFDQSFCDTIQSNDKLIITYSAVLTDAATIAGEGNPNTCWLAYGGWKEVVHDGKTETVPSFETATVTTLTHTYGVDIVKTNNSGEAIPGANFKLYRAHADGSIDESEETGLVKFIYDSDKKAYIVDTSKDAEDTFIAGEKKYEQEIVDTAAADGKRIIEGSFSVATLIGLDNGTYYIRETAAPSGYNMLTEDVRFTVSSTNMKASFIISEGTPGVASTIKTTYTGGGIRIENQKGDKLPETGGTGTALFITLGAITVLGAGVLLVTKKRMSMIED